MSDRVDEFVRELQSTNAPPPLVDDVASQLSHATPPQVVKTAPKPAALSPTMRKLVDEVYASIKAAFSRAQTSFETRMRSYVDDQLAQRERDFLAASEALTKALEAPAIRSQLDDLRARVERLERRA